ncbi:MAG: DUF1996 domain-containing protein [Actinomycetota bacterium]
MRFGAGRSGCIVLLVASLVAAACSPFGGDDSADGAGAVLAPDAAEGGAHGDHDGHAHHDRPVDALPAEPRVFDPVRYQEHLDFVLDASVRNRNHDDSPFLEVPSADLVPEDLYGPRSDYLQRAGGNPENAFPTPQGGQFRVACEFSHFAYDDPLIFPDQPGAAHLHMFFGNTHVNAYSTYDTLLNSGSSTCNGQELNRTGYWVPAMFDGDGNVRIPERVVVYYKGEGASNGASVPYPPEAAFVSLEDINTINPGEGGSAGKYSFVCSDQYSAASDPAANTMPNCDGDTFLNLYGVTDDPHVTLEMNVKFPQCWNGENPADWNNYSIPTSGGWYFSECPGDYPINLPNLEYFVNYRVNLGEDTGDWYLSSDVDPETFQRADRPGGHSIHGDWWGAWNAEVNQMWIDNCVNYAAAPVSGCGFGYLTDGGPDGENPVPGPALRMRPQYLGPDKVPAEQLFQELCAPMTDRAYSVPTDAAWCIPG